MEDTRKPHKPIHLVHAIYTNRVQLEVVWILMRLNGKSTQITNSVSQCWQDSVEYVSINNYKVLCAWLIFFSQLAFIIHFYSCTTALNLFRHYTTNLHVSMHIYNTVESYIKRFLTGQQLWNGQVRLYNNEAVNFPVSSQPVRGHPVSCLLKASGKSLSWQPSSTSFFTHDIKQDVQFKREGKSNITHGDKCCKKN